MRARILHQFRRFICFLIYLFFKNLLIENYGPIPSENTEGSAETKERHYFEFPSTVHL